MSKSRPIWRETAEVIGVLGVIASLIFVALEIRQNTTAVRSATIQEISRWSYDNIQSVVDNEGLREAIRASCGDSMTDDQRQQLQAWMAGILRIQMNRFHQSRLGFVDEELALTLGGRGGPYQLRFFAQAWANLKEDFSPDFVEFVEREIRPQDADQCAL